jgi:short subunit fatty acids transporter
MVLLETALALPLLAAVAIALAWGISLTATTMALGDAARQVARDVARGVDAHVAVAAAQGVAPGATIRVDGDSASVVVVVDKEVSAPVPILSGISVTLSQRVAIPREWT